MFLDPNLIQNRLRNGESVELEGVKFRYVGEWNALEPGDFYTAERNTKPRLLTVNRVDRDDLMCVFPNENAYPFDLYECVKIEMMED